MREVECPNDVRKRSNHVENAIDNKRPSCVATQNSSGRAPRYFESPGILGIDLVEIGVADTGVSLILRYPLQRVRLQASEIVICSYVPGRNHEERSVEKNDPDLGK